MKRRDVARFLIMRTKKHNSALNVRIEPSVCPSWLCCVVIFEARLVRMSGHPNLPPPPFFYLVQRPLHDYFSSYETRQSVGGTKTGEPREKQNHLTRSQAELGLSHMVRAGFEAGQNPDMTIAVD